VWKRNVAICGGVGGCGEGGGRGGAGAGGWPPVWDGRCEWVGWVGSVVGGQMCKKTISSCINRKGKIETSGKNSLSLGSDMKGKNDIREGRRKVFVGGGLENKN